MIKQIMPFVLLAGLLFVTGFAVSNSETEVVEASPDKSSGLIHESLILTPVPEGNATGNETNITDKPTKNAEK